MTGTLGLENRLRDEFLGWLTLIFPAVGAQQGLTHIYESRLLTLMSAATLLCNEKIKDQIKRMFRALKMALE